MIREAKEKLTMPESVVSALVQWVRETPMAHGDGRICTPGGKLHHIYLWMLEVDEEEAAQIGQTDDGAREGLDLRFGPIKEIMLNMLRTERAAVGKEWHRASRMLPKKPTTKAGLKSLAIGCLAYGGPRKARPGELECHPEALNVVR